MSSAAAVARASALVDGGAGADESARGSLESVVGLFDTGPNRDAALECVRRGLFVSDLDAFLSARFVDVLLDVGTARMAASMEKARYILSELCTGVPPEEARFYEDHIHAFLMDEMLTRMGGVVPVSPASDNGHSNEVGGGCEDADQTADPADTAAAAEAAAEALKASEAAYPSHRRRCDGAL